MDRDSEREMELRERKVRFKKLVAEVRLLQATKKKESITCLKIEQEIEHSAQRMANERIKLIATAATVLTAVLSTIMKILGVI